MKKRLQDFLGNLRKSNRTDPQKDRLSVVLASGLFDPAWYAERSGRSEDSPEQLLGHFLETGWTSGIDPSPRFSVAGYLAANPEVAAAGANPLLHYVLIGRLQGRWPGYEPNGVPSNFMVEWVAREFDGAYYTRTYPDFGRSGFSPLSHFVSRGWRIGRNPHDQFSTRFYLEQNADVRAAGINPFYHYLAEGRREGRLPHPAIAADSHKVTIRKIVGPEFDAAYYLSSNPDVCGSGIDALTHYLEFGWKEGRDPNPTFSVSFYLDEHTDVRQAGLDPFFHFLTEGRREGRRITREEPESTKPDENVRSAIEPEFDTDYYLTKYPDIKLAAVDPIEHYLLMGWREGRDPCNAFSTRFYLETNPDVRDAGVNPLYHFVVAGRLEGRQPVHPGGWKVKVLESLQPVWKRRLSASEATLPEALEPADLDFLCSHLCQSGAQVLLVFSHDNYTTSVGGIQHCLKLEQVAAREQGVHHLTVFPTRPMPFLSSATQPGELEFGLVFNGDYIGTCRGDELDNILSRANSAGSVCRTIVHSLLGHSPEVTGSLIRSAGSLRNLFWLHDFFSLCPSFTLMRNEITYCGAPHSESLGCSLCVFGEERKQHIYRVSCLFEDVGFEVVSPSAVALEIWQQSTRLRPNSVTVHSHCFIDWREDPVSSQSEHPVRIAFAGHPANHKGWQTFVKIVELFADDPRYEFYHFGSTGRQHAKTTFVQVSVIADGAKAMQTALRDHEIDAVLLWCIWPETFSFVAHEALAAGASIITCPESGNIARLAAHHCGSQVLPDEKSLISTLEGDTFVEGILARRRSGAPVGDLIFGSMSIDLMLPQETDQP